MIHIKTTKTVATRQVSWAQNIPRMHLWIEPLVLCPKPTAGDSLPGLKAAAAGRDGEEQEVCKQIARQLQTQYVEGIHGPKYYTVTLKSRLRVTQGHWKRNHWADHTRLTISQVI